MRRRRSTVGLSSLPSGVGLGTLGVAGFTGWSLNAPRRCGGYFMDHPAYIDQVDRFLRRA